MSLSSLLPPGVSIPQAIQLFYQAIQDTTAVNYASAAATTWIAYDICLTFADEVELIWKAKWSIPKVLYFGVRYYSLLAFIGSSILIYLAAEGMFALRLWAFYKSNKKVLSLIVLCFGVQVVESIVIAILHARQIVAMPRPAGFPLPGCFTFVDVPLKGTLPIIGCTVITIYFALLLYKLLTSEGIKLQRLSNECNELPRFSRLPYLLIRDGIVHLAMSSITSLILVTSSQLKVANAVNLVLSQRANGRALEAMGVSWVIAAPSVASSRLLLNLRGFIGSKDGGTTSEKTAVIMFGQPPPFRRVGPVDDEDDEDEQTEIELCVVGFEHGGIEEEVRGAGAKV
ncbi:hypothetical protein L226DRAFT_570377 [Lentinus tigrinus ALCF2SS1-7]|uniref:uncharacterized protein n=1 Tax=Lentinus tigrinus ALCF2SS1-7 TaxID=1328758 RepID=UPI001165CF6E|nr:hypothetical protein L226DRAFT_570377 [Lentinus tigrinus ALCF2SS1-7]